MDANLATVRSTFGKSDSICQNLEFDISSGAICQNLNLENDSRTIMFFLSRENFKLTVQPIK